MIQELSSPASFEMQAELKKCDMKNRLEIEKAVAMEYALNDAKINFAQKKMQMLECWKEARKASYVAVHVGAEGELEAETKSALMRFPKRMVANFNFVGIAYLQSDGGADGIFLLMLYIGGSEKHIFLNESKVGDMSYLMKKISAAGGRVYGSKKKDREELLAALWAELCSRCTRVIIVPEKEGWYRDIQGEYKFTEEGDILWGEVLEKAK